MFSLANRMDKADQYKNFFRYVQRIGSARTPPQYWVTLCTEQLNYPWQPTHQNSKSHALKKTPLQVLTFLQVYPFLAQVFLIGPHLQFDRSGTRKAFCLINVKKAKPSRIIIFTGFEAVAYMLSSGVIFGKEYISVVQSSMKNHRWEYKSWSDTLCRAIACPRQCHASGNTQPTLAYLQRHHEAC